VAFHAGHNRLIAVAGRYDEHFPATLLAGLPSAELAEINVK
jgi:hypothetical protein